MYKNNSPVTLSRDNPDHLLHLTLAFEEEFKKNPGEPISVKTVFLNEGFKKVLTECRFLADNRED